MYRIENGRAVFNAFELTCGARIALRLAYQWLMPNGPVRRHVLLCHGITSSHEAFVAGRNAGICPDAGWGNGFIGPGRALDPTQGVAILCINAPGSCFGSSGPADTAEFPPLSMADIARAHWALIDRLGIERIDQLVGYSFGGYVAIEMACQQETRIDALLHLASGLRGRADPQGTAALQQMIALPSSERRDAIRAWRRALLERYGQVRWLQDRYGAEAAAHLENGIDRWTAAISLEALLTLRAAATGFDRHDITLSLPTTLIRWDSDPLFPPEQAEGQDRFHCIALSSPYGHMAPLAEPDGWTPFLQGP